MLSLRDVLGQAGHDLAIRAVKNKDFRQSPAQRGWRKIRNSYRQIRRETDQANEVFERLIQRVPSEARYRGTAAETMLSAKQGAKALQFAEGGLKTAREKNDRDSEQYFLELVDAATRQAAK